MISTILGISRVVNSTRAGIDMRPMIGPRTNPRNRSMIVQAAPPTTCRNVSGHSSSTAMPTIRSTSTNATIGRPARGTIWNSGRSIAGGCASATAPTPVVMATSAISAI
jgi:hypothetical protein